MKLVPRIIVCPFCQRPFIRGTGSGGTFTQRFICPFCHRYVKITEVKKFLIRTGNGIEEISFEDIKKNIKNKLSV